MQISPYTDRGSPELARSTLEEERQEALESVIEALAAESPDTDRTAACRNLLQHLARSTTRHRPVAGSRPQWI